MNVSTWNASGTDEQKALDAVATQSLFKEALAWPYCVGDVFVQPSDFARRTRLPDDVKTALATAVADVATVFVVSYLTAATTPEPLAGSGTQYLFVVHPVSFAVIYAGTGTWRS